MSSFKLIRLISKKFSESAKGDRFFNFARLVAFLSVMLGSLALIIALSVLHGFDNELRNKAISFTSHLYINTFQRQIIEDSEEVLKEINSLQEIKKASAVIEREALIKSKKHVEGIMIRGIDDGFNLNKLKDMITEGEAEIGNKDERKIVISQNIAKKLKLKVGDETILYVINDLNNIGSNTRIRKMKVSGIYRSGLTQYDEVMIFTSIDQVRDLYQMPENSCTGFEVLLHNIENIDLVSEKLDFTLGYPFFSMSVYRLHNAMFAWIDFQKEPIPLVLGLISLVAIINIITTLLVSVIEKTHSIGILRSMGMKNNKIMQIFIYQGLFIGFAGTIAGCLIALIFGIIQQNFELITLDGTVYYLDALPISIELWHYALVISVSLFFSFFATIIPSYIATKISIVKAIRFR